MDKNYVDKRFILPTSNICERIISNAGFVLTMPKNIVLSQAEETLFLWFHRSLWDLVAI